MMLNDDQLGLMLLERGLLFPEEYDEACRQKAASGKSLSAVLLEKRYLSRAQLDDALASNEGKTRFCDRCNAAVYVPRSGTDGECCPRCLGPVGWKEEAVVGQVEDLEKVVQITQDELPDDVRAAKTELSNLFGKYVLLNEVGRGGYGVVHRAWDTLLGEYVAIKFLREPELIPVTGMAAVQEDRNRVRQFLREARAALRLRHPHIIPTHDVGKVGSQYFISMEYVDGQTLTDKIDKAKNEGLPSILHANPESWLNMLRDLAHAAHYAHTFRKGIVHCDLKPCNILLDRNGVALIMDFGLAQILGSSKSQGFARGTPGYMAPEQAMGRAHEIGPHTDIYGIGAVVYALMTGRAPFIGEPAEVLTATAYEAPIPPAQVAAESFPRDSVSSGRRLHSMMRALEAVCLKCLAKHGRNRYSSALVLAEEFERLRGEYGAGSEGKSDTTRMGAKPPSVPVSGNASQSGDLQGAFGPGKGKDHRAGLYRSGTPWEGGSPEETDALHEFRARLLTCLDRERPVAPTLTVNGQVLRDVEIMKATKEVVFLLSAGQGIAVPWAHISYNDLRALCDLAGMTGPNEQSVLSIISRNAGHDEVFRILKGNSDASRLRVAARESDSLRGKPKGSTRTPTPSAQ